jgi:hypothetical protein
VLLWLFVVQSVAWCVALHQERALASVLCDKICSHINPTSIAVFNVKQFYLWVLLAITSSIVPADGGDHVNPNFHVVCAHLMAYTEVLHSFKSLVFVSRVLSSIQSTSSASAMAAMGLSFATALALFLAAMHGINAADETPSFIFFNASIFFFAVPEFCADLYVLRWWTQAADSLSDAHDNIPEPKIGHPTAPSDDCGRVVARIKSYNEGDLLAGRVDWATRGAHVSAAKKSGLEVANGSTQSKDASTQRPQSLVQKMFSAGGREGEQFEQTSGIGRVSGAMSILVCGVSAALATYSRQHTLDPFAVQCRRGGDSFEQREQLMDFASGLRYSVFAPESCKDVWPQLCTSSCNWAHGFIQCDPQNRATHFNMSGLALQGTVGAALTRVSTLQAVDLSNNQLTGRIPPQLSRLSQLVYLNLSRNRVCYNNQGRLTDGSECLDWQSGWHRSSWTR